MTDYVHVTKEAIDAGPAPLPEWWVDTDGTTHSGMPLRPLKELAALGWLAVVDDIPAYDPAAFRVEAGAVTLVKGVPHRAFSLVSLTPELVAAVKAEAMRRILAIAPEYRQRNMLAQADMLLRKGVADWSDADKAAWAAGELIWGRINAIRLASDAMEQELANTGSTVTSWPT